MSRMRAIPVSLALWYLGRCGGGLAQVFLRQAYPPAAVCGPWPDKAFDDQYSLGFSKQAMLVPPGKAHASTKLCDRGWIRGLVLWRERGAHTAIFAAKGNAQESSAILFISKTSEMYIVYIIVFALQIA